MWSERSTLRNPDSSDSNLEYSFYGAGQFCPHHSSLLLDKCPHCRSPRRMAGDGPVRSVPIPDSWRATFTVKLQRSTHTNPPPHPPGNSPALCWSLPDTHLLRLCSGEMDVTQWSQVLNHSSIVYSYLLNIYCALAMYEALCWVPRGNHEKEGQTRGEDTCPITELQRGVVEAVKSLREDVPFVIYSITHLFLLDNLLSPYYVLETGPRQQVSVKNRHGGASPFLPPLPISTSSCTAGALLCKG